MIAFTRRPVVLAACLGAIAAVAYVLLEGEPERPGTATAASSDTAAPDSVRQAPTPLDVEPPPRVASSPEPPSPDGLVVTLEDAAGGAERPPLAAGALHFLTVARGHVSPQRAEVVDGVARLAGPSEDETLLLRHFRSEDGRVGQVVEGHRIAGGTREHRAFVAFDEPWRVVVVGGALGLTRIDAVEVAVDDWAGAHTSLAPRPSSGARPLGTSLRVPVALPEPDPGRDPIYWFRAPGHVWTPYRWSRRFDLGPLVVLAPEARLRVELPPGTPEEVEVELRSTDRLAWGRVLLGRAPDAGSAAVEVATRPGSYLVTCRETDEAGRHVTVPERVELEAGRTVVRPTASRAERALTLHLPAEVFDPTAGLTLIDALGVGRGTERTLEPGRVERGGEDGSTTLRWDGLEAGIYVFGLLGSRAVPLDLRSGDLETAIDPTPSTRRVLTFVGGEAHGFAPMDVDWVRWQAVAEGAEHLPDGFVGQPTFARGEGTSVEVMAPPGELRCAYSVEGSVHFQRIAVGEAESIVVAVPDRVEIDLAPVADRIDEDWLRAVRVRGVGGERGSEAVFASGTDGRITRIRAADGDVEAVYLPAVEDGSRLGLWVTLPPGSHRVRVEADGSIVHR